MLLKNKILVINFFFSFKTSLTKNVSQNRRAVKMAWLVAFFVINVRGYEYQKCNVVF